MTAPTSNFPPCPPPSFLVVSGPQATGITVHSRGLFDGI